MPRARTAKIIELASWLFAALGALLPIALATPLFAIYVDALEGATGVRGERDMIAVFAGIVGGTIAGKWVLHACIARFGLRRGARWARDATAAGLAVWWIVDSLSSLAFGAWPNVIMINFLPLLAVGVPLVFVWRALAAGDSDAVPDRIVVAVGWVVLVSGIGMAVIAATPALDFWFAAMDAAGIAGPDARPLALAFFGPMGGTTAAQGAMMVYLGRRAGSEPWATPACLASILTWFVIDSSYSLAYGAAFNVLFVNLPFVVLVVPPLLWAWLRRRKG